MLAFLLSQQGGYTKYSCFPCFWYTQCDSPSPNSERKNFAAKLHIKLGFAKQYIKALKSDSKALCHVQAVFPKLSEAKVKGGIFTGPLIRQMLSSRNWKTK